MITLTATDLLANISQDELDGLTTELIESGQPDPVQTALDEGLGVIKMYLDPLTLADDALARLWRILAVCWIYNRLSRLPEKREEEQKWALGVLEDIRDGKFKNLQVDPTLLPATSRAAWGSATKI